MEFRLSKGLWERSYFLSGPESFFYRFADTGFKDKWSGLWHRERKFLEFLALRAEGEWLSESQCRGFRYNGAVAEHSFRKGISQRLWVADSGQLVLEVASPKALDLELIPAVNIRKRCENRTSREYSVDERAGHVRISNELGSLAISCSPRASFRLNPEHREHCPSGEAQSFFLPGTLSVKGKRARLVLTPCLKGETPALLRKPGDALKERERILSSFRGMLTSDSRELDRGFYWSAVAAGLLLKRGQGMTSWYAGLPWFQHFWARDVLWVLPSLIMLGYFQEARRTLRHFASRSQKGRIPNLVSESEGTLMNGLDPSMLWLMCTESYVRGTGDRDFLKSVGRNIEDTASYLLSCDQDGDGYIEHDASFPETWMDTLRRDSRGVEMQALYSASLGSASRMLGLLGRKALSKDLGARAGATASSLSRDFFRNGFYADRLAPGGPDSTRTANALVPVMLGIPGRGREILSEVASPRFFSKAGVRTRACGQDGFSPSGYHTGAAWSLTTAWACAAEFSAGSPERGWGHMKTLLEDIDRDALGCIGECWDSESTRLTGCPLQLWGSGFVPRLVDECMLGLEVDCLNRKIFANPRLPKGISKVERERPTPLGNLKIGVSGKGVSLSQPGKRFRLVQEP